MKQLNLPFQLNFSLEYETRTGSKLFLESINADTLNIAPLNIDEYFIIEAYRIISQWFKTQKDERVEALEKRENFVKVLGVDSDFIGWVKEESFEKN